MLHFAEFIPILSYLSTKYTIYSDEEAPLFDGGFDHDYDDGRSGDSGFFLLLQLVLE